MVLKSGLLSELDIVLVLVAVITKLAYQRVSVILRKPPLDQVNRHEHALARDDLQQQRKP